MLLFSLCIALNTNRNLTIALGAVSTTTNPFWSQRLPAFHYCSEDNFSFSYEYSYNERKTIIPFSNTPLAQLEPDNFTHTQCQQLLTKQDIKAFERAAVKNSFLRFYIGKTVVRSPFFRKENNKIEFYTHYTIEVDNTTDTISPFVSITPGEPTELHKGSSILVTFSFRVMPILTPGDSIVPNTFYFLQLFYFVSAILFVVSIIGSYIFYRKKRETHNIPLSEVWRIPPLFNNASFLILFGMILISCAIYLYLLKNEDDSYGDYIIKIVFPSLVVPVTLFTVMQNTLGIKLEMANWVSPSILYFFIFILIPHIYTVFFGFFGSFRGFRIRYILLIDPLFLIAISSAISGAGLIANLLVPFRVVDAPRGKTNLEKRKVKSISQLLDWIYVILAASVITPISNHLFEIFFDDQLVNGELIACILITFCSIASAFALLRALPRTTYVTESWQSGISLLNFFVALLECFYLAYVLFIKRRIFHIQAVLMVGVFGFAFFITILSIGTSVFYVVPFIPILFTFSQPKSN